MISTITEAEILYGRERRPQATRLHSSGTRLVQALHIRPWDSAAAQVYGKLRADLRATGKNLAVMDLLIAAHAVSAGAILVSHDKAFQQLTPLLAVVDWATDLWNGSKLV